MAVAHEIMDEIKKFTEVDTITANGKITTMKELLAKIRKYQHLKWRYGKGDYDILIRMAKLPDGDIEILFYLMMQNIIIEKFCLTELANEEHFFKRLYDLLIIEADYGPELTFINTEDSRNLSMKISRFVLFCFDKSFFHNNLIVNDVFENLYYNSEDCFVSRRGIPAHQDGEIYGEVVQKLYK